MHKKANFSISLYNRYSKGISQRMLPKAKCNIMAKWIIETLERYNYPAMLSTINCSMTGSLETNRVCADADTKMLKGCPKKESGNKYHDKEY